MGNLLLSFVYLSRRRRRSRDKSGMQVHLRRSSRDYDKREQEKGKFTRK